MGKDIFKSVVFQNKKSKLYRSHAVASKELATLVEKVSLKKTDDGYKKLTRLKKTLNKKKVLGVHSLVDRFLRENRTKSQFKDAWRNLVPGTDEHFSTENVYTVLKTIQAKKLVKTKQVDINVLKDFFAVASHFRLPTEDTGHNALGHQVIHPHGNKKHLYITNNKAPGHSSFDMMRKTVAIGAGQSKLKAKPKDGTGALMSMVLESAKFSIHMTGNTTSPDNKIQPQLKSSAARKTLAFENREKLKEDVNVLEGTRSRKQKRDAPQYTKYDSPLDRTVFEQSDGEVRTRSLSPRRRP